jgi:hypothetical protein
MRNHAKFVGLAASIAIASLAPTAGATNYSLWIHGRTGGTPSGFNYWTNGSGRNIAQGVGVNAQPVNYNGTQHISQSNPAVVAALNTYCTGGNSCYIQCHSAGCAQIGYAEAYNPGKWNIVWVLTGGSAAGGSELAGNTAYFFTGYALDLDLAVGTMRGMYNHDVVGDDITGYVYNYVGGDYAVLTTCFFPGGCLGGSGGNDSAVAFHSAGHFRNSGTDGSDSSAGSAGGTWWDYSWALWVDSIDGSAGHCISGSYPCQEGSAGGVMGVVSGTAGSYDK